ncbi:hypothetical protein [Archangium lipolyticum]|uniref:hypothetical protein n=1 Tax=Archangium lipolyticum TaxID=2970465 RepID=UPI00214A7DAE|nr:hypothetical protein [Archangium lipolyticum]
MTYWRQETFEALGHAASSAVGRWPMYAEFARLQSLGLRKKALAMMPAFAEDLAGQEWSRRWEFAWWLYTEALRPRVIMDMLAPHSLRQRVLFPTLKEGLQDESKACPEAYLWLVQHHREDLAVADESPDRLLREGIQRFPGDGRLRRALADRLLGYVEHATHHLDESAYLGNPAEDLELLREARELLDGKKAENGELLAEIEQAESLVRAWRRWSSEGRSGDFPAWCRSQGLPAPNEGLTFYYGPKR